MEAKELMIGDILNLFDNDDWIIPCKVVELHTEELLIIQPDDTACDIVGYDMVRPMRLTPEILEKNGWKEAQFWHEYQDGKNTIQSWLPDMRGIINGVEIQHFQCEYVHQYQHLLRLCGLNELADSMII